MIDLPSYDGAYPLVAGHIDAPFTAKPQKTHNKTRRMMRPRRPRDLDAPTRGLVEENIGRSVTPGPRVERARLPLHVAPNSGPFATLFGQFALAIPTAVITAFVLLWAFTAWTHGPSHRTADEDSDPTQAAVEQGTQATKEQPILVGTPDTAAALTTGVAEPVGTDNTAPGETPNSHATSATPRRLDREEITYLLKRGEELVAAGQLGPARLVLRRAAEAGDPNAAFALAITYDPILLRGRVVIGVAPDDAMARAWYEKAKELGSIDASRRLEAIGQSR
jgi:hypothetical protein